MWEGPLRHFDVLSEGRRCVDHGDNGPAGLLRRRHGNTPPACLRRRVPKRGVRCVGVGGRQWLDERHAEHCGIADHQIELPPFQHCLGKGDRHARLPGRVGDRERVDTDLVGRDGPHSRRKLVALTIEDPDRITGFEPQDSPEVRGLAIG